MNYPKSRYLRLCLALGIAESLLGGCASAPYVEPKDGPTARLKVEVMTAGRWRESTFVQTFEHSENCRGVRNLLKNSPSGQVRIGAASPISLQFIHIEQAPFPLLATRSCRVIVTFEPKPSGNYAVEAIGAGEGCAMSIRDLDANRAEVSVRRREFVDIVSGGGNLCR